MPTPRKSQKIRRLLDDHLLRMLQRGKKSAVVGGQVVEVDLSEADLEVARKRARDADAEKEPRRTDQSELKAWVQSHPDYQ